jgi:hypothetical protein
VKLTAYHEHKGLSEETIAFDCSITLDGKKVAAATNTGQGGPNRYHFFSRDAEATVTRLAAEWARDTGRRTFETLDAFLSYISTGMSDQKIARSLFRRASKVDPAYAGVVVVEKDPLTLTRPEGGDVIVDFLAHEYILVRSIDDVTTLAVAKGAGAWCFHVLPAETLK